MKRWKNNLNEKDFITKTDGDNIERYSVSGGGFKITIIARKINNKKVTIVDGLEHFLELKDVSKTFAKHFACSVTLKEFQSKHEVNQYNLVYILLFICVFRQCLFKDIGLRICLSYWKRNSN